MTAKNKPIPEEVQREAEHDRRNVMPVDGEAESTEEFLETEAPYNDERRRYSPEFNGTPNTVDELSIKPDGQDTYPEPESAFRARGENIEGTKESIDKARQKPSAPESEE